MNNRHDRVLQHVLLCWIFTICSRIFTWCVTLLCIYEMQIMLPNLRWQTFFEWCCNSVRYWCFSTLFANRKLKVSRRHVYDFFFNVRSTMLMQYQFHTMVHHPVYSSPNHRSSRTKTREIIHFSFERWFDVVSQSFCNQSIFSWL